jgi:rsbT co-antagonist protein RsbR
MHGTTPDGDNAVCKNPWAVLDTLADGFAVLDAHGTIRYLNAAWQQQFLAQRGGEQQRFHIGGDYLTSYTAIFAPSQEHLHAMRSGLQAVIQGQREHVELDAPSSANSQPTWATFTITPCTVDSARGAMVQQRTLRPPHPDELQPDAQQSRAALLAEVRALQRENRRLEQMVARMPLATIELESSGIVVRWNTTAEHIFGWSAAEMLGQNLFPKLFPDTPPDQARQRFNRLADEPAETSQTHPTMTRDGSTIICQWHTSLLPDESSAVAGLLLLAEDITEAVRTEQERATIQERMIEAQQESLRELSTPLIPINDRTVIMPLIGSLNRWRAQQMMQMLLAGIEHSQARIVILDITGVASIDAQIAQDLVSTAQAVRLLGAQMVLTGIRPDVAQTLVHLGITLHHIVTRSTLQSGITYAMKRQKQLMKP